MLNDSRSHGLWEATAPQAPTTAALDRNVSVDVVVVRGGYTGMSCALHLTEAGWRVVLLEAREIGFGDAGRNGKDAVRRSNSLTPEKPQKAR